MVHSMRDSSINAQITYFLGNSNDCAQTSTSLLLLELGFNRDDEHTCILSWIPLQNLLHLNVWEGSLKRLWQNNEQAPSQLKELVLNCRLTEIPDLSGLVNQLERLEINGKEIQIQGWCLSKSLKPQSFVLNTESIIRLRGELTCRNIRAVQSCTMYMSPYFPDLLLFKNLKLTRTLGWNNGGGSNIDLGKLVDLKVNACHELGELCFEGLNCVEKIGVDSCEKLICLEFIGCKKLKTLSAIVQSLVMLNIRVCPELEELKPLCRKLEALRNLTQMSRLERIEIDRCKKLQDIAGIEELQGLKTMKLFLDSNSNQWLQRLSRLPSLYMRVIGRAADGAHSTLNSPDLFSSIMGNYAAVHKIHTGEDGTWRVVVSVDDMAGESDSLSAIIVCAHVVVRRAHLNCLYLSMNGKNLYNHHMFVRRTSWDCLSLRNVFEDSDEIYVKEGEWIVSMVIMSDENQKKHFIQDKQPITISMQGHNSYRIIKNACVVRVKKGQEWEAVQVVKAIGDQLYKQERLGWCCKIL